MDGEWVSGLLSENGEGGGNSPHTNLTYKEIFDAYFPQYLMMGMTADQYWDGDVYLAKGYREAYRLKRKEENFNAFLHGKYIYAALICASPLMRSSFGKGKVKAHDYLDKPYDLFEDDRQKTEEEKAKKHQQEMKEKMKSWMSKVNQKYKK